MLPLVIALPPEPAPSPAAHLVWAQRLLQDVQPRDNTYASRPTVVQWRGVDGAERSVNRSVCSSFISALLQRAYGTGPEERRRWLGVRSPLAADYFTAIAAANRFLPVTAVSSIEPGDLLATRRIRVAAINATEGSSGHLMVAAAPAQRLLPCSPATCLYRLEVIDSSRSGHGAGDTRSRGRGGVGRGAILLRSDAQGRVQAYRWSENPGSRWRTAAEEPMLIGRLCPKGCGSKR